MYTDRDIAVACCRRQDLMAEAERERLYNVIVGKHRSLVKIYRRTMARFGAWLVAWGNWLQERYTAKIQTLVVQGTPAPALRSGAGE